MYTIDERKKNKKQNSIMKNFNEKYVQVNTNYAYAPYSTDCIPIPYCIILHVVLVMSSLRYVIIVMPQSGFNYRKSRSLIRPTETEQLNIICQCTELPNQYFISIHSLTVE